MRVLFARWSIRMRVLFPQGPGPTGFWAIMIDLASLLVWDENRPGWLRCCYSRCVERQPVTMAMSWGCITWQFHQSSYMILVGKTSLSTVVTNNALPCNGIAVPMPVSVFLRFSRGYLSPTITRHTM